MAPEQNYGLLQGGLLVIFLTEFLFTLTNQYLSDFFYRFRHEKRPGITYYCSTRGTHGSCSVFQEPLGSLKEGGPRRWLQEFSGNISGPYLCNLGE